MGIFNNEIKKKEGVIIKKRPIYYLSAARQITDSGFGNWEIASYVGFNVLRAADGLMIIKILNVCVPHADVNVIKQTRGEGKVDIHRYSRHVYSNNDELVEALNTFYVPEDTLLDSHHEKTNSKLHLMRSSCVRLFNIEDIIPIKIINGGSIRVTIFGIGNKKIHYS